MTDKPPICEGQILTGPQFNEPMRVETFCSKGPGLWSAGLVAQRSEVFRRVTLSLDEIKELTITDPAPSYSGDGRILRLGLQAYRLGIAYEFDPYFGLSISRVDPLPHQIEAVYGQLLKLSSVRFLLADDAGAGKTIMAGLLIRELKLRGIIERILIVCPANLSFQWQRELGEKFDEKFHVLKGSSIRDQFGVNQWVEYQQIITSLDLAKRTDILPGLKQAHWDLVVIDEAHRMSARDETHKSQRYKLGELLRDSTDHILLLTATPHKGDPKNFTLFLQLLDRDVYADVKSINKAMERQQAPFYLRRTKEAMVDFPKRQADGTYASQPVFTKRITRTAGFNIDGDEHKLYLEVTHFVKRRSRQAAHQDDNPRARAVGFLMALYQRRLASCTHALRCSLENRAKRLSDGLQQAKALSQKAPPTLPDFEELDEMEDNERERLERIIEAVTLSGSEEQAREEIAELKMLAESAKQVEDSGSEAKLSRLKSIMQEEGFFNDRKQRLLLFTEFKDTLNYLVKQLSVWGFKVGCIHGGMRPGARDEPGSRLYVEQQFREGAIQVLVATEAAGEGINLQCCHVLFNYDIPWNPNRLEQRMGRIHRYGQQHDCLIFNFVAANTIEGKVLQRLHDKLQEIRKALDNDAVFNVIGEVLPAAHVERVLRDYYAGELGAGDLEDRLLKNVDENHFRTICQTALEGLSAKKLNLEMLVERRARAQERRVVPETIARFMSEGAEHAGLSLKPDTKYRHTFYPGRTPAALKAYGRESDWKFSTILSHYPRLSTDRETAEKHHLEWAAPGHSLFEALRLHSLQLGYNVFAEGACFYSLQHDAPARLDFYTARVVDGLGHKVHERLFAVELAEQRAPQIRELDFLGNLIPAPTPGELPPPANLPEEDAWLHEHAMIPFIAEVRKERINEIERITEHVKLSLGEVVYRIDGEIGRANEDLEKGVPGASGRLKQAETRCAEAVERRDRRIKELKRQQALTLQDGARLTSVLILPHPERESPEVRRLRPNPATEMTAMRVVMEHEKEQGRQVSDVHEKNLGYDITSLDTKSGELRLIEIKGLAGAQGTIMLTPNEQRVAEDRQDCYWLYVVSNCGDKPELQQPIRNPARLPWHEVSKVQHYRLDLSAMTESPPANEKESGP